MTPSMSSHSPNPRRDRLDNVIDIVEVNQSTHGNLWARAEGFTRMERAKRPNGFAQSHNHIHQISQQQRSQKYTTIKSNKRVSMLSVADEARITLTRMNLTKLSEPRPQIMANCCERPSARESVTHLRIASNEIISFVYTQKNQTET
jgi:hypothetical protein